MQKTQSQPTLAAETAAPFGRGPLALWLVLGGLLALRIAGLLWSKTDLFFDEAQYWAWAKAPAFGYYSKPPLIAWIIWLTTALFGDAEWAVRLSSPLLHTLTAFLVGRLGARLYDERVGFWAAITFATLPAVSLSSLLVSTDVPLLTAWAATLLALCRFLATRGMGAAMLFGLALGVGLNAKYAMAYLPLCLLLYAAITRERRWVLRHAGTWSAFAIGATCLLPNLWWNYRNGFATLAHTGDNANWTGTLFHPVKFLEFFAAQFGVFGPVLFAVLLILAVRRAPWGRPADRFLLMFSLPILAAISLQALLSRAHANWAATAYVAATILVVAVLCRPATRRLRNLSLILHAAIALAIPVSSAFAPSVVLPGGRQVYARVLGWHELADKLRTVAAERKVDTLVFDTRKSIAEMLYYMRDDRLRLVAWPPEGRPTDHFEMTRPYKPDGRPAIVVTPVPRPKQVLARYPNAERLTPVPVPRAITSGGSMHLFAISGKEP